MKLPLALECEWNPTLMEILGDFQKLLVSRADHRIFLCSQPTNEEWVDCVEHLTEQIRLYNGTRDGDRYLLGCWHENGWSFHHYFHPMPVATTVRVWLFQAVPETYNLVRELKRRQKDTWTVGRNRDNLRPGNIALLWKSGSDAGIYGCGKLTGRCTAEEGKSRVAIEYTKLLDTPILKTDLQKHPLLKKFGVIAMPRGKNPFRVLDKEWEALKEMSTSTVLDLSSLYVQWWQAFPSFTVVEPR